MKIKFDDLSFEIQEELIYDTIVKLENKEGIEFLKREAKSIRKDYHAFMRESAKDSIHMSHITISI